MKIKLLTLIGLLSVINVSFAAQPMSVEEYNQRQAEFAKKKENIVKTYRVNKEKQAYNAKVQQYNANQKEQEKIESMSEQERALYILGKNNTATVK